MPTELREYQSQPGARPVEDDNGDIVVICRAPSFDDLHNQRGRDGDFTRWRLIRLRQSVDPEDEEPDVIDSSSLFELEEYGEGLEDEFRFQPLFSRDLDLNLYDEHPNRYAVKYGRYLLYCPAPEAQLFCYNLDTLGLAWSIDARRPENGVQKAFRILGVKEDSGEFVVAFRERLFIEEDVTTVQWNPTWGEDSDPLFLCSWTMDDESSNVSPAGRLRLDPETGAINGRWDASEIEDGLFRTYGESNNYYKYETLTTGNWACDLVDDYVQLINDQWFAATFAPLNNSANFAEFEISRTDSDNGRVWSNIGLRIEGDGVGMTALKWEDGLYNWAANLNPPDDPPPVPPPAELYIVEDDTTSIGAFLERIRRGWDALKSGTEESHIIVGCLNSVGGYADQFDSPCTYTSESTLKGDLYKYPPGHELYSFVTGQMESAENIVDFYAIEWQSDDLAFSTDGGDEICENYVLPGALAFSSATRSCTNIKVGENYEISISEWNNEDPWYENLYTGHSATLTGRFFYGSTDPEIPVPGVRPPHSLVRCCFVETEAVSGTVYGPDPTPARGGIGFTWRLVNWSENTVWTKTIQTTKSMRQCTVPVCIGGLVLTVIQEFDSVSAGPLRLVVMNANTGGYYEVPIPPENHGGFDHDEYFEAGVFLATEVEVVNSKLLVRVGTHLLTIGVDPS